MPEDASELENVKMLLTTFASAIRDRWRGFPFLKIIVAQQRFLGLSP